MKCIWKCPSSTYLLQHINRIKCSFSLKLGDSYNSNLKISQEQLPHWRHIWVHYRKLGLKRPKSESSCSWHIAWGVWLRPQLVMIFPAEITLLRVTSTTSTLELYDKLKLSKINPYHIWNSYRLIRVHWLDSSSKDAIFYRFTEFSWWWW